MILRSKASFYLNLLAGALSGLIFFTNSLSHAGTSPAFTLDGQLSKVDGSGPWLDAGLKIKLQILNPTEDCILYEESQTIDTQSTNGYFNVQVGTAIGNTKRTAGDSGNTMREVYGNLTAINGKSLSSGAACTYHPVPGDSRYLRVSLQGSDGSQHDLSPNMAMNSVPSAVVAETTETLQGKTPDQFLNLATNPTLTQTNVENIFSATNYPRLTSLLSVPPTNYVQTAGNGAMGVSQVAGDPSSGLTEGQFWYDNTAKVLKFYDGSGSKTLGVSGSGITSIVAGTGLTGGTISMSGQTIAVDVGTVAGKIVQVQAGGKLPALDGSDLTNISGNANSLQGKAVSASLPTSASQVLKYDGSTNWAPGFIGIADIRSMIGPGYASFFPTSCTSAQTLTYNAPTDSMICSNISVSSFTGSLAGDVTGTQGATVVSQVGGSSAANVHLAELAANAATHLNTASAVVKRDGSGNFAAGTITANLFGNVTGSASLNVLKAGDTMTGPLVLSGDPSVPLGASTKQYVDSAISTSAALVAGKAYDPTMSTLVTGATGNGKVLTWDQTNNRWTASAPASAPVSSVFGRTGAVTAQSNDYTWAQIDKTTSSLADLTTRSAADLSSGTLADARLSSNVPLKNAANNFTGVNTFSVGGHAINIATATDVGLTIKGASAQSADLQQWKNNSNSVLYSLNPSGTPSATTDLVPKSYVDSGLTGKVTSITAGTGLTGGTITSTGTIGLGTELAGLNGLSTTGFVKRTAAGTYSTPAISLTADVSGVLPLANGGSNANLTASNGGIVYSNASQMQILSGTATAGLPLISGASTTPAWSTVSLASGNVTLPAAGNISNASGAMTVSASTNLTLQANTGSTTTLGNPNTTSATVINGGGVGGGITLVPGSLGLAINGWSSAGFVKNNASGVLNGGNSILSSDISDAASANTANKLVLRDGSGNFAAGTITGTGMVTGTLQVTGGSPSSGKVLTSDGSGNATWQSAPGGFAGAVNMTSTPYSITTSDSGKAFYYTNNATGVVNLPALSGVSDGFSVTITRDVAKNLTITPVGSDKFPGGVTSIEMQGQNIQSMTVMKLGSTWKVVNKTDECIVGQDCWTANATGGMKQLYAGTLNGRQYFTTPGGCTDSANPTCAGGTDTVTKVWSSSATTAGNIAGNTATVLGTNSAISGLDVCSTCGTKGQSQYLAEQFTDTAAAKFCENMDYAGYTDWYLPAKEELALLYRNGVAIGGFVSSSYYWSSTEYNTSYAWYFGFNVGCLNTTVKYGAYYVRCVRRF